MELFFGESERCFRALIENTQDIIAICDLNGRYLYCSTSVLQILGNTPDEMVGTSPFEKFHPTDLPRATKLFLQIKINLGVYFATRLPDYHKNGTWLCLVGIDSNLLNNPDVHGAVVNCHDATGRPWEYNS
jgi:PAS domain S-box-containing protein